MSDERLIALVREHEVLYNAKCSGYRDVALRHIAWEEVSRSYGKSIEDCKDIWNRLRNCYSNAIKRRRRLKERKGKRMPPWRLEKQMSFLKGEDNTEDNRFIKLEGDSYHDDAVSAEYLESFSSSESIQTPIPEPNKNIIFVSTSRKNKANTSNNNRFSESPQEERHKSELDDLDHFFLSMSRMVKKLPKFDQNRIKMDLHIAINKVELRLLEEQEL